jgi:hypothetical protein
VPTEPTSYVLRRVGRVEHIEAILRHPSSDVLVEHVGFRAAMRPSTGSTTNADRIPSIDREPEPLQHATRLVAVEVGAIEPCRRFDQLFGGKAATSHNGEAYLPTHTGRLRCASDGVRAEVHIPRRSVPVVLPSRW